VTDDVEETRDRMIADHVLRLHRYLPPGVEEGTPAHDVLDQSLSVDGPSAGTDGDATETSPFEKFDPLLHMGVGSRTGARVTRSSKPRKKEILSIPFIKKYIQYAKSKPPPVLTKGAADYIVQVYASFRNMDMEGNNKKVRSSQSWGIFANLKCLG
jgi:DNA replication licensing factor MCM3